MLKDGERKKGGVVNKSCPVVATCKWQHPTSILSCLQLTTKVQLCQKGARRRWRLVSRLLQSDPGGALQPAGPSR